MTALVTDTHPLVWYITNQKGKLPRKVRKAFDEAVSGHTVVWIPMTVLWEFAMVYKAGKLRLEVTLDELIANKFYAMSLHLLDLQAQDIVDANSLNFTNDPFDAMVVASARRMECPLITADSVIHETQPCEIFWD